MIAVPNGSNDIGDNGDDKNNIKNKMKSSIVQNNYWETWNFNPLKMVITLHRKVCKVKYLDFQKLCDYSVSSVSVTKWKPIYSMKKIH